MRIPTMWYWQLAKPQISLRIRTFAQSLEYSMNIKLLTEHNFEFLSLKGAAQACQSLHLSKYHIVGNHMSRLIFAC